jgi:hypothetical protein
MPTEVPETALVKIKPDVMIAMLERVIAMPDLDVAKLQALLELKERYDANEAKKSFVEAMNRFKKNPPEIIRNRDGEHHKYSTLDVVCKAVMTALSEQGISHRWEYKQTGAEWIEVSCILTHEAGHSERTTMGGPPDSVGPKGSVTKNHIQALASTRTYLERYTLLGAVGLESANDTDGVVLTAELSEQLDWIANARNPEELRKLFEQAYKKFDGNNNARKVIIEAKDKRKREL